MSAANPPDPPAQPTADEPRDARLQAALRQAPDHALQPPAALAQSIRAAAHAAVKPRARAPWWAGLQGAWLALATPRPVWAGATAALLVSVLTVRLWVDEPVPAAVEAAAPAAAPATTVPASPAAARSAAPAPAPAAAAQPAPAKPRAPQKAAPPRPARASPEAIAEPKAEAREARAADDAAAAAPARNDMARQRAPAPAPAPAPAAAPAPRPAPAAAGLAKAIQPQRPSTLDAWLLAARNETDSTAWPITPQQRRLLRLIDPADDSRWVAAAPAAAAPAPALRDAEPTPLIWPSPRGSASLLLLPTGLRWTEPDGSVWILPLSAEQLQRMRQAL